MEMGNNKAREAGKILNFLGAVVALQNGAAAMESAKRGRGESLKSILPSRAHACDCLAPWVAGKVTCPMRWSLALRERMVTLSLASTSRR